MPATDLGRDKRPYKQSKDESTDLEGRGNPDSALTVYSILRSYDSTYYVVVSCQMELCQTRHPIHTLDQFQLRRISPMKTTIPSDPYMRSPD